MSINMRASSAVVPLVELSEGLRLNPYLCPAKVPTIGYGTTHYENGVAVTLKDLAITKERAVQLLIHDLMSAESIVNTYVHVQLTQGQFDALVDFVYNLGAPAFKTSTMLRLINSGSIGLAAEQLGRFVHANGEIDKGLVTRRAAEKKMYLGK